MNKLEIGLAKMAAADLESIIAAISTEQSAEIALNSPIPPCEIEESDEICELFVINRNL